LLGRCDARAENELVADAALVLLVVEVDLLVLAHDRADGFSGRARDAAHQHRDLILDEQLGRVLRVNLVVRLGVELDEPQLAAENAALPPARAAGRPARAARWAGGWRGAPCRPGGLPTRRPPPPPRPPGGAAGGGGCGRASRGGACARCPPSPR